MVIDDDEDIINLFKLHLKNEFEVKSEMIGSNAIEAATTVMPKVVLLDLHMPNVDGYEVLKQFRAHPSTSSLPVICISADSTDVARDRAYELGAIGFIKKPPDFKLLAHDIQSFLKDINLKLESTDKKRVYLVAFNDAEKNMLLRNTLTEFCKNKKKKVLLLSWREGQDFFAGCDQKMIEEGALIYLKINPSLITKFPYMQELSALVNDMKSFLKDSTTDYVLIIDEPLLLFGQHDSGNASAKIFSLNEIFKKTFASTLCFSTKQLDVQKDALLMDLAKAFVN